MKKKKTLDEEMSEFLDLWNLENISRLLRDILPIYELYDVTKEDDWVESLVGGDDDNVRTIRLIRTVYLISRLAEFHAGKLVSTNVNFKKMWKKIEKAGMNVEERGEWPEQTIRDL